LSAGKKLKMKNRFSDNIKPPPKSTLSQSRKQLSLNRFITYKLIGMIIGEAKQDPMNFINQTSPPQ
jgi:hypothetical protein